jgi:nucleotide-binding universal stress UspA family protein
MAEQSFDYQLAVQDFRRARRKAAMTKIMAYLQGETTELLSYEDVRKKLKVTGASNRGVQEIPLDAIVGSVGRYADFTRQFLPKRDSDETRWARVQTVMTGMLGLPPIEVYQIGDAYFVLDGNHRVSVARQMGATHIEAYVTEIRTKIPLTPDVQPDELDLKSQYAVFLKRTRLDVLRPDADLSMTVPGKYHDLEKQIEEHRYYMGLEQQREIPCDEAVPQWYDDIYLPLARLIENQGILTEFPDRTVTDLYWWISRMRTNVRQGGAPAADSTYRAEIQSDALRSPIFQLEEIIIQAEYADFLEHTHLTDCCPEADLQVTVPGKYQVLEEHIEVHRYFMGLEQNREVPLAEAVTDWYKHVYLPVAQLIREKGILRDFPDRTETDLYLWIAEHQAELEKQLGWKISSERAATDLANRFSQKTERFVSRVGGKLLDAVTPEELSPGPAPGQWRKEYLINSQQNRLFTNILVPVSGEEKSWRALEQAILFGQPRGARLYGLHVVPSAASSDFNSAVAVKTRFEQRCAEAGIQGELAIETGRIARRICDRAFWTDLIIMSLTYRSRPQAADKLWSGFRTIIRRCPRPVLAVPNTPTAMKRAVLAYDGSPKADEALFVSAYLAGCWKTELSVTTVTENGGTPPEALSLAQDYLRKRDVKATFIEKQGSVGAAVMEVAREQHCDCIIMGGYGRRPMLEIVLGSTVDYILRESQLPVLICR